ncbi:MAG TPA: response regulator [Myxococcaceae bacterium]|nr:response regulator [Myxococcaceae bacterium]
MRPAPRLLLVDDDASNALILSALLEETGFDVRTAASCAEARRCLASARPFAAILLDEGLPDGSGSALLAEIRAAEPLARVILYTGRDDLLHRPHSFDAVALKGEPFDQLLRAVRPEGAQCR